MAQVLFIRPPQVRWANESKRLSQPLGLLNIIGLLQNHGHDTYLCDAAAEGFNNEVEVKPGLYRYGLSDEEIEKLVITVQPNIVCVGSMFTMHWDQVIAIARIVKRLNNKIVVIIGGHHASGAFSEILKTHHKDIDFVVLGEGEVSTLCLINILEKHDYDYYKFKAMKIEVPGVAYRNGDGIKSNPVSFTRDLDSLPDPAFNKLKAKKYTAVMSHYIKPKGNNFFTYLTQRGCKIGCEFCTSPFHWGAKVRINSIEKIKLHVRKIRSLGYEEFIIQDDNILIWDDELRKRYLEAINDAGFYAFNDAGYYYPLIEKYHIDELKEYGVYGIFLPVESPNLSQMHNLKKYVQINSDNEKIKKLRKVTEWLNNCGIKFYSAIMVGFPGNSKENINIAVDFARFIKKLGATQVTFNFAHPYPGTPFYKKFYSLVPEERRWENNPEYYNLIKPVFPLNDITLEDLEKYINENFKKINNISDRNPSYLWG